MYSGLKLSAWNSKKRELNTPSIELSSCTGGSTEWSHFTDFRKGKQQVALTQGCPQDKCYLAAVNIVQEERWTMQKGIRKEYLNIQNLE